jgi:ABC-type antimicrobial peptide transport system ATPase subunit
LHLIAGLVIPDAGDILVNDELVATAKKNVREPQQRGVMPDGSFGPNLSRAAKKQMCVRSLHSQRTLLREAAVRAFSTPVGEHQV